LEGESPLCERGRCKKVTQSQKMWRGCKFDCEEIDAVAIGPSLSTYNSKVFRLNAKRSEELAIVHDWSKRGE